MAPLARLTVASLGEGIARLASQVGFEDRPLERRVVAAGGEPGAGAGEMGDRQIRG